MVDIQTIGVILTAASVTVAAIYYITTIGINQRNSRISLTHSIMQTMLSEESQRRWIELMNMEWNDYDDFENKYGSDVNPDNFAKRMSVWLSYDMLGHLLKKNIADAETFYISGGTVAIFMWEKYKPILYEHRRRYVGADTYSGLEYLAQEMLKIRKRRDPSYEVPKMFTKYIPEK